MVARGAVEGNEYDDSSEEKNRARDDEEEPIRIHKRTSQVKYRWNDKWHS